MLTKIKSKYLNALNNNLISLNIINTNIFKSHSQINIKYLIQKKDSNYLNLQKRKYYIDVNNSFTNLIKGGELKRSNYPKLSRSEDFESLSDNYKQLNILKDNYVEFTKDLIFMAHVDFLSFTEFKFGKRIDIESFYRPGFRNSSHIKIYQTEARKEIIDRLNNITEKSYSKIIQFNGYYGVGKSYTLIDYVVKSRVQTLRELENRNPEKILNLFVYLYLNNDDNKNYIKYFRNELIYSCYPLIKNELDFLITGKYEHNNIDFNLLNDKDSLINLLLSLYNYTDIIPQDIFNKIKDILENKYNAKLVIILDQINEIKSNAKYNENKPNVLEYLYNFLIDNKEKITIIQCASYNNEYTRENYIKYLKDIMGEEIYIIDCDEIFNKEEANMYIRSFEEFDDDCLGKIRYITNNIPLFISFLNKSKDELPEVTILRKEISSIKIYKSKDESIINYNKQIIQNKYIKILKLKIEYELKYRIDNFINNYYKYFDDYQKIKFADILSKLNDIDYSLETKEVIDILDFQLLNIQLDRNNHENCKIKSIYPNILINYNERLDKSVSRHGVESVNILETLNRCFWNDRNVAGYYYESLIYNYFLNCILYEDIKRSNNLEFIKKFNNHRKFDLFDYENINHKDIDVTNLKYVCDDIIYGGLLFGNEKVSSKSLDGGFFIPSEENETYYLYTYDTTIGNKSKINSTKLNSIKEDITKSLQNLERLFKEYLKNLKIKLKFKKHYFIMGIDFEKDEDRNMYLKIKEDELNLNHYIDKIKKDEKLKLLNETLSRNKHYKKNVDNMKMLIKDNDPEHFGIVESKVKITNSNNNGEKEEQYYSLVLDEIEIK